MNQDEPFDAEKWRYHLTFQHINKNMDVARLFFFLVYVLVFYNPLLEYSTDGLTQCYVALQNEITHRLFGTAAKRSDVEVFVIL